MLAARSSDSAARSHSLLAPCDCELLLRAIREEKFSDSRSISGASGCKEGSSIEENELEMIFIAKESWAWLASLVKEGAKAGEGGLGVALSWEIFLLLLHKYPKPSLYSLACREGYLRALRENR